MSKPNKSLVGVSIVFFHQSADMYGSDKILLSLASNAKNAGGEVVVLLPNEGLLTEELRRENIDYFVVPVLKISRSTFSVKGLLRLIADIRFVFSAYGRILSGRKVDIVHSNTIAVLGGALWARHIRAHHMWHVHEIIESPKIVAYLFGLILRMLADSIVCNSNATMDWLIGLQPKLKSKSKVIWNGIRCPIVQEDFYPKDILNKFKSNKSTVVIGLVGRINKWKGHALLVDAAEILNSRGFENFSIVFVGSPPAGQEHYRAELKAKINHSSIENKIFLVEFIQDIWDIYRAIDIVCVPSTEPEPFGLVAVEAMAMGKPVVASKFGGVVEIVANSKTGLTFHPKDSIDLADALQKLLVNEELRFEYGNAGYKRYSDLFSESKMHSDFLEHYLWLLER